MLPRWIAGLLALVALVGAVMLWLFPLGTGSYTATHGPTTAFRDKQASQIVAYVLVAGATALTGITLCHPAHLPSFPLAEDSPGPPPPESRLEFDCTLLC